MIGPIETGTLPDIVLNVVPHEGLTVRVGGRPGRLAVIDVDGRVVAAGEQVADEIEGVVIQAYRNVLQGQGHLRVFSGPLRPLGGPMPLHQVPPRP